MTFETQTFIVGQALLRARLLAATAGFPSDEIEDVRQELLLDYLRRSHRFDDARGNWDGFVRGVMRNQATVLLTRRRRRVRREILAGDLFADDCLSDQWSSRGGKETPDQFNRSLDVQNVLRELPRHLQVLASLLPDLTVPEICARTKKSRSRVYQMIRQLRRAFTEAGLSPHSSSAGAVHPKANGESNA